MKDELELLWTGLKVRVKDTFTSTFFIAWVIWNWRAILYVLYPMDLDNWDLTARLNFIEGGIYDTVGKAWRMLAWGPLVSTLFFLLVLPVATNWIDKRYQRYLIERRKNQIGAQSDLVYTSDEVNEITEENRKMKLELDQLKSQYGTQSMELESLRQNYGRSNAQTQILLKHMSPEALSKAKMEGYR